MFLKRYITNDNNKKYRLLWIEHEVNIFFAWIGSSTLFIAFAYIFKIESYWKIIAELYSLDSNIFNHKSILDYLHYYKFEHDLFNICMVNIEGLLSGVVAYWGKCSTIYYPIMAICLRIISVLYFIRLSSQEHLVPEKFAVLRKSRIPISIIILLTYIGL